VGKYRLLVTYYGSALFEVEASNYDDARETVWTLADQTIERTSMSDGSLEHIWGIERVYPAINVDANGIDIDEGEGQWKEVTLQEYLSRI
jgi:hypothetical protein